MHACCREEQGAGRQVDTDPGTECRAPTRQAGPERGTKDHQEGGARGQLPIGSCTFLNQLCVWVQIHGKNQVIEDLQAQLAQLVGECHGTERGIIDDARAETVDWDRSIEQLEGKVEMLLESIAGYDSVKVRRSMRAHTYRTHRIRSHIPPQVQLFVLCSRAHNEG